MHSDRSASRHIFVFIHYFKHKSTSGKLFISSDICSDITECDVNELSRQNAQTINFNLSEVCTKM